MHYMRVVCHQRVTVSSGDQRRVHHCIRRVAVQHHIERDALPGAVVPIPHDNAQMRHTTVSST